MFFNPPNLCSGHPTAVFRTDSPLFRNFSGRTPFPAAKTSLTSRHCIAGVFRNILGSGSHLFWSNFSFAMSYILHTSFALNSHDKLYTPKYGSSVRPTQLLKMRIYPVTCFLQANCETLVRQKHIPWFIILAAEISLGKIFKFFLIFSAFF